MNSGTDIDAIVRAYHERTKHHFHRYAAGPDGLDWDSQPNPFRTFAGAPTVRLPLTADAVATRYADLHTLGAVPAQALTIDSIAALLQISLGLSAWKRYGQTRWALRCNPSSGNLHPTEAYLVCPSLPGLDGGIYHYVSRDHLLERRATLPRTAIASGQCLVALSSIHWREAWKYGERAFRYCQHDVGHAIAAVRYAAAACGWKVLLHDDWSDAQMATLLGLDRDGDFGTAEREAPDVLLSIGPAPQPVDPGELTPQGWTGTANVLSPSHPRAWPVIDDVAQATEKPVTSRSDVSFAPWPPLTPLVNDMAAATLFRQRRSAQGFDRVTSLPLRAFQRQLDALLPRGDAPPFDLLPWPARVHPVFFVHRVEGLRPGLYVLPRREDVADGLRAAMRPEFLWERVEGWPSHLALYRLLPADTREAAATLSCHQAIAGDGVFAVAMLAEFDAALTEGPWGYRRLHWEAGVVGHVLYLEAEAAGVRGTGIGCYFDDAVHQALGLSGTAFQSIYHFTVGAPLMDTRLETLPAYSAHSPA